MYTTVYGCNTQPMVSSKQIEFEKKLLKLGLSYSVNNENYYIISSQTGRGNNIDVRLISSLVVNKQVHGSKNGDDIQAIGLFKFLLPSSGQWPDIFVFTFQNPVKNKAEFLIIPTEELVRRFVKMNPGSVLRKRVEMVFWLMADGFLYNTTNISIEAEWYSLSKRVNGRMADGTDLDYTKYLNSWCMVTV